jgi:predicted DNA-binding protein YlxM (UPF0122 family)
MNIRKNKIEMFQAIYLALKPRLKDILTDEQLLILHLYIIENKGLVEIAEELKISDYSLVRKELKVIRYRILALA